MATLLLSGGIVAAVLFVLVFTVDGATRPGYDARRHPVSALALGGRGWIQTANFLLVGLLMLGAAAGARWELAAAGGAFGWLLPALFAVFGVGLVLSGAFPMDPMRGYPPGAPDGDPEGVTRTHRVHDQVGSVVFVVMPALCFAGAAWFSAGSRAGAGPGADGAAWPWALGGAAAGVALLVLLVRFGAAWEANGAYVGLLQRAMIVLGFCWIVVFLVHLL